MSGEPIGVGVVGLGTIGVRHVEVLGHLGGLARLVAASGGAPATLRDLGHADAAHLSPEEVIAHPEVDLVVLCTPSGLHGEQTLDALRAGKHVVVEKPLSVDVASAEEIVRVSEQRRRFVSVISQRRLEPQSQYLKRLLDDGTLGRPVLGEAFVHWLRDDAYYAHASWRAQQDQGGGSLMNQGLHSVDLLAWLMGPVTRVTAQYATLGHRFDAEDTTVATLQFASGALGAVVTSTATPPGRPATMKLFTGRGAAEFANSDVAAWDFDGVPAPPEPDHGPGSGASDPSAIGLAGHLAQWRDIVDAYRTGRAPEIGARDGLRTVQLLCGIYEAAETGRAVTLEEIS
ncbi:Gfo/Idh/MocA family protein [Phytoactinopolyspora alkaliphila]|uniref:Gfo/Idh/MocA family protein n=1 Tax=Phytoactinopolyspora alkaliphila TaxID=1783498 RepID=UPI001C202569